MEDEKKELKEEMESLKKEQDDLLVLLSDQDAKIDKYKAKLKELGQEVRISLLRPFFRYMSPFNISVLKRFFCL